MVNNVRLNKRGGAGAGDPNHPALKIDPNATYNPFPPKSTYLPELDDGPHKSGSKSGSIAVIVSLIVLGLALISILGWFLQISYRRKKTKNFKKRRLSSVRTRLRFPERLGGGNGRRQETSENVYDDDLDDVKARGKSSIYGHEVFEMSHEFNQSSISLPYDTSASPSNQLNFVDEEEDEDHFTNSYSPRNRPI